MMENLENELTELYLQENQVLEKIDVRNKNKEIKCEGCGDSHKIGNLTAIQTHWYTPSHGCTEGDYWNEGELQFICPETGIINRLLFNGYEVSREEKDYANNPEEQFKRNYKKLFLEIKDSYDKTISGEWVNNLHIDQNRKKFGLVEKIESS